VSTPPLDILLVNVVQRDGGFLVSRRRDLSMKRVEPLGLEALAAWLRTHGRRCGILDEALDPEAVRALARGAPAGVGSLGFYCNDGNRDAVCAILRALRLAGAQLPLLVGGPGTQQPRPYLEAGARYAVQGEGERSLVELLEHLEGRRERASLRGVAWLEGDRLEVAPPQEAIVPLDTLPWPDRGHASADAYFDRWLPVGRRPFASVLASRGCPQRCAFCSSPRHWGGRVRVRSVEDTVAELEALARDRGVRFVSFKDDIFGLDPAWLAAFCARLERASLDLRWMCNFSPLSARPDPEATMAAMARAGCAAFKVGLQAVDPGVLRGIQRDPRDPERVAALVAAAQRHGILAAVEFIFGLPGSSHASADAIEAWVRRVRPDLVGFYSLSQLSGSDIGDRVAGGEPLGGLSPAEARRRAQRASRRFYGHPRHSLRLLARIARRNPAWFLGTLQAVPAIMERVGLRS